MLFQFSVVALVVYGFFKNVTLDGTYLPDILFGHPKNFTTVEVTQDMATLLSYSKLGFSFLVFMITDIVQYKSIIVAGSLSSLVSELWLYYGTTVTEIQVMHVLDGFYKATSVAYFTYIYTQVKKQSYQHMTSVILVAPKAGTLISAIVAQFIYSMTNDLYLLIVINIVGKVILLLSAVTLPSVTGTQYSADKKSKESDGKSFEENIQAIHLLWEDLSLMLSNGYTLRLCIWWTLTQGAFSLVMTYYVQVLWSEVSEGKPTEYNAGVEAIAACSSSLACLVVGKLAVDWQKYGDLFIQLLTAMSGICLLFAGCSTSLTEAYILYVVFYCLHDAVFVIISSQVMLQVKNDSYGLIYGINFFLQSGLQAILTYIFTSKNTLALSIRDQFAVSGWLHVFLGLPILTTTLYKTLKCVSSSSNKTDLPHEHEGNSSNNEKKC